ncbi:hypothetical protein [Sphingomonas immobilis]|uniref:Lipoprotein n=1 Tax=Sphingomonas immobilis TaxID=3063997 RepID=A0ABT8ZVN6_9SPHN|nr:hypothetical protein [Sphingomonas sp. CA1-15]MDO7841635.1 hypothetical protein [Sphingomonas sp. CA1-15]
MLFRLACRFLIMILVVAGVRIGACSKSRHGSAEPAVSAASAPAGGETPRERQERMDRARFGDDSETPAASRSSRYASPYDSRTRDDVRSGRDVSSEELIRAMVQASRDRQPEYRPGQPMSEPRPTR